MKHIVEWVFVSLSLVVGALLLFFGLISAFAGIEQSTLSGQDPLPLMGGVVICLAFAGIGAAEIALPVSRCRYRAAGIADDRPAPRAVCATPTHPSGERGSLTYNGGVTGQKVASAGGAHLVWEGKTCS